MHCTEVTESTEFVFNSAAAYDSKAFSEAFHHHPHQRSVCLDTFSATIDNNGHSDSDTESKPSIGFGLSPH